MRYQRGLYESQCPLNGKMHGNQLTHGEGSVLVVFGLKCQNLSVSYFMTVRMCMRVQCSCECSYGVDQRIPGKTDYMAHCVQDTSRTNATESSTEVAELLEVNQQWDQQFRSMKESYERKVKTFLLMVFVEVAEMKTKLDALEKEQQQEERDSDRQRDLALELLHRKEKEKESLSEELQELKKENKLLKERNALANKKKEHYECEIKRLNKALQDALKIESSPLPEHCLGKSEKECSHEELRTEMEVLKQQVQIYEEDFKKERSDRERLNQEKEELQKINQTSRSQLNRLNSKIKVCQMEKEKLEKQLKQRYFPTCNCVLGFHHLRDPSTPTGPGAVQEPQKLLPDYQWYAPDQFQPDVQHKANATALHLLLALCLVMLPFGMKSGVGCNSCDPDQD
ncbi:TNFAIP3-interacting protein 3 [Galemys pyrenaicus]|uniref:TNFAIP3-interacting protein 3 n=1 Tax=Galemys pyrenaicus TaxID=202257 RepID=A0A8J6A6S6_GALPY|nr:TNFAIP3-interacting protein 3 [Galemys pyrenaicus]